MKQSLRIVLADNEEIVHKTIADYLSDSGHQVDRVHDKAVLLEALEIHDYDLALVDLQMPDMDRLSLLSRVRKEHPEMPVIIITEGKEMDTVIQSLRLGAVDFLKKPVKLLELDAVLEKSVRSRELAVHYIQTEEALRESEERYRLLAESVTDGVWVTDMNLRPTYVNPAVARMLGYDVEEVLTLEQEEILTSASLAVARRLIAAKASEEDMHESEMVKIELKCKDGSTIWVNAKCAVLRGSGRQAVGILGILRDITTVERTRNTEDRYQDDSRSRPQERG